MSDVSTHRRIEFMGLPGSGKTTLGRVFRDELKKRDPTVLPVEEAVRRCLRRRDDGVLRNLAKRLPERVWEPLSGMRNALSELHAFASGHVALFHTVFDVLNREELPLPWRQCTTYFFFRLCAEYQLLQDNLRDGEGVVVEEGFALGAFGLWGYFHPRVLRHGDMAGYTGAIPLPDAVFRIETDPGHSFSRLQLRPELPLLLQGRSDDDVRRQLVHGDRCLSEAAAELEGRGVPVFRVPNPDGGLEESCRRIGEEGVQWVLSLREGW